MISIIREFTPRPEISLEEVPAPQKLAQYQARLRDIEEQLITSMARWENLLARAES